MCSLLPSHGVLINLFCVSVVNFLFLINIAARAQFLFVNDIFSGHVHACLFIEAGSACGVFRIHNETNCLHPAFVKLAKGMEEQSFTQSALTPGTPDSQSVNPASSHAIAAKGVTSDLIAIPGNEP